MRVSDSTPPIQPNRSGPDEVVVIDDQAESSFSASLNHTLPKHMKSRYNNGSVTSTSTKTSSISSTKKPNPKKIRHQESSDSGESDYKHPEKRNPWIPTPVRLLNLILSTFWCLSHLAIAVFIAFLYSDHYVLMAYFLAGFVFYVILIIGNRIRLPHLYVFAYMYTSMTLIMLTFLLVSLLFMDILLVAHGEPYADLGVIVRTDDFWVQVGTFESILFVLCVFKWFTLRKMFHDYSLACARHWNQRKSKRQSYTQK
ncbi:unnamed protein product [Bursaphelenchus xylophilus]|uniref:(pine wood nematode) hypothetical protein n=1 Tax=Bursaphelenchus xylophilus TaxID=6326 RepID=A0A1I7S1F2_BURXY|nr:unnamed protein product [Bursaphelenchus xylophilus]CAG9081597.1 unnamed protein product [Bursaphelenchus xylophilus]